MSCKQCGSCAINHHCHGRDGSDEDLCDVCYWRARVEARLVPTSAEYAMGYAEVEGWVMVPRRPTPEMITAGRDAPMCATAAHNIIEDYVALYEAMLAAAPSNTHSTRSAGLKLIRAVQTSPDGIINSALTEEVVLSNATMVLPMKSAKNSATQAIKHDPAPARVKITSANGVTGMILSLHDDEGTVVFRVYDAEHNFTDYLLNHSDLRVTIQDEDAFFYQSEDPERASLDHSPATLGIDVLEAKGNHAAP